ncbi:hypothetical protein GCM10010389_05290 [Streptomyces echinoruber]|uniref:Uncharacterized protein n=1 Tax=Streptomyces echinoruber TaxID=68898 RepID=A0A918QT29_9ACTN|nr:hypothetical protein GCM10010389_05290 [Streptomyces echinoruber]
MEIVAQWVRTSWTKRSRGGEGAARRNAAPIGFSLPDAPRPLVHVVRMREEDGFRPHGSLGDLGTVDLQLRETEGRLRVFPRVQPLCALPPRPRRPPAVRLVPGQWVRWQLNYRFSSTWAPGTGPTGWTRSTSPTDRSLPTCSWERPTSSSMSGARSADGVRKGSRSRRDERSADAAE